MSLQLIYDEISYPFKYKEKEKENKQVEEINPYELFWIPYYMG